MFWRKKKENSEIEKLIETIEKLITTFTNIDKRFHAILVQMEQNNINHVTFIGKLQQYEDAINERTRVVNSTNRGNTERTGGV